MMRKSTIVRTLILFVPILSFGNLMAQKKNDTKIIVTVSDTANLFNRLVLSLYERGFTLEQKDEQLGFVATTEKTLPKLNASAKYRALIKDSTITLTGSWALNTEMRLFGVKQERTFDPVKYSGMKGSVYKVAWAEMEAMAKQFGTKISYDE